MRGVRKKKPRWKRARFAFLLLQAACCFATTPLPGAVVNTKLNGPLAPNEDVADFKISPDGNRIVFRAGHTNTKPPPEPSNESLNLFSASIDGGPAVRLNALLPSDSTIAQDYAIASDSRRVVYRTAQDEAGKIELYGVAVDGPPGSGVKLSGSLPPNGGVAGSGYGFLLSPDGSRVVYRANQDDSVRFDLYSVPAAGPASAGIRINDLTQAGSVVSDFFLFSPDGQWVVYLAASSSTAAELFSVPVDGPSSAAVRLNGLLVRGGAVLGFRTQISPDSSRVVYIADQQIDEQLELYSVPIRGPASLGEKINGPLPPQGDVQRAIISPDSQWVAYFADQETEGKLELFGVPIGGTPGGGQRISHTLPANRFLDSAFVHFTPDSSRLVYFESKNLNFLDTGQIYSTPIGGAPASAVLLNKPLVSGGSVYWGFQVAEGSGRVVYMADQDTDEAVELYSVPVAGPAEQGVKINWSLGTNGDVTDFRVSPDGLLVAYRADRIRFFLGDDVFRLWAVPVAGPSADTVLHGPPPVAGGNVSTRFSFTPDGVRIVYIADQDTDNVNELYVSYDRPAAARGWEEYE